MSIPIPPYRIATQRLVLRCYAPSDAPLLHATMLANIEHLKQFLPWAHHEPQGMDERIRRIRQFRGEFDLDRHYVYGIFDPQETQLLGSIGLHKRREPGSLEIGYWIDKNHCNRGYASEASATLTRIAFEVHHTHRVEIYCDPDNLASASVPRKLGFTHEGTSRQNYPFLDTRRDTMLWALIAPEYPNSPAAQAQFQAWDITGEIISL
jgi:RimJ/RimL family protein N-acetyltransferase